MTADEIRDAIAAALAEEDRRRRVYSDANRAAVIAFADYRTARRKRVDLQAKLREEPRREKA